MQEIVGFYTAHSDEDRLPRGWGLLELERTREIVLRDLGESSRTILDVGGGTGVYTEWLAELGHAAHLIDLTPSLAAVRRDRRRHSPFRNY